MKNVSNNLINNTNRLNHDPKLSNLIEDTFNCENDIEDSIGDNDKKETQSTKVNFFPLPVKFTIR